MCKSTYIGIMTEDKVKQSYNMCNFFNVAVYVDTEERYAN